MEPTRDNLLAVLKQRPNGMTIHAIHNAFNVNPKNEEDRKAVWQIGQRLAHLVRDRWVSLDTSDGTRFFTAV